jgi:hypothetical protein
MLGNLSANVGRARESNQGADHERYLHRLREPCDDGDWAALTASVRYWGGTRRASGTAPLAELWQQAVQMPASMARSLGRVSRGDLRLALRYCGWRPAGQSGVGEEWQPPAGGTPVDQ